MAHKRLINREDNVPYHWSEWQLGWHREVARVCLWLRDHSWVYVRVWLNVHGLFYASTEFPIDCMSPSFCSSNHLGYLSSWWIFVLCCQAVQPTGRCNLQWHSSTRALVQISVLKQMRHCKTTSLQLSRLGYSHVKWCVCWSEKSERAPHCRLQLW